MTSAIRKDVGQEQGIRPYVDYTDAVGHVMLVERARQKTGSVYRPHYESYPDPVLVAAQEHIDATPTGWPGELGWHKDWFDPTPHRKSFRDDRNIEFNCRVPLSNALPDRQFLRGYNAGLLSLTLETGISIAMIVALIMWILL